MSKSDFQTWLKHHDLTYEMFAKVIGVTPMAVHHWLTGYRTMSLTVTRLCRLFDRYPALLEEFGKS